MQKGWHTVREALIRSHNALSDLKAPEQEVIMFVLQKEYGIDLQREATDSTIGEAENALAEVLGKGTQN